jgi:hypothetical protein
MNQFASVASKIQGLKFSQFSARREDRQRGTKHPVNKVDVFKIRISNYSSTTRDDPLYVCRGKGGGVFHVSQLAYSTKVVVNLRKTKIATVSSATIIGQFNTLLKT